MSEPTTTYQTVTIRKGRGGWGAGLTLTPTDENKVVLSVTSGGIHPVAARIAELSGGEAQRIKLATELQRSRNSRRGYTVYLLDEPTTGLHPADISLLVKELNSLVEAGQTVIVVEHDVSVIAQADRVIEMGPGAGADGGQVVASGTPSELAKCDTATGRVLAERSA